MFDNLGWYYEPNIGVSFNSIEFRKRLLEFFFSEKWIEFTPDILIFYPHFFTKLKLSDCKGICTIWLQRYMHHLIAKKISVCGKNSTSLTIVTILLRRNPHHWPQLFIGDPKFSLETPSFSWETPNFHWRPQVYNRRPQAFHHNSQIFLRDSKIFLEDPQIFFGDPQLFIGDLKLFIGEASVSSETPRYLLKPKYYYRFSLGFQWKSVVSDGKLKVSDKNLWVFDEMVMGFVI